MRILFVSGTTVGGSGRSQRELAARLIKRGHEVLVLADPEAGSRLHRFLYEQLSDLAVRWGHRPGAGLIRFFERRPGRRCRSVSLDGVPHRLSPIPENAFEPVLSTFDPDVVVGNSVLRLTWRKVMASLRASALPGVLYVRETEALNHFDGGVMPADAVVANSESLAIRIRQLGVDCDVFPSVVETSVTATTPTRQVALVINPIESRGVDFIWALAERLPEVPFVLQESWPLTGEQLRAIESRLLSTPNVSLRRAGPPGPSLYRDARALLVPYRIDNRPRVIPEAQANGIPVVAADVPALVEATGEGGVVAPLDDAEAWAAAIERLWVDESWYGTRVEAARVEGRRFEDAVARVVEDFEAFLGRLAEGSQ